MANANVTQPRAAIKRFQEAMVWSSGKFRVDDQGRVWRGNHRAENRVGDYLQVKVMIHGIRYYTCAHRLVWHVLKGPIPCGMVINHLNGRKDDNRPENLEITTYSGNTKHAYKHGLIDEHGERNPAAKLTNNQIGQIRSMYALGGYTMKMLGDMYGVKFQHISRVVRGHRRAKQGGPIAIADLRRRNSPEKDKVTGRFVGKKAAGRMLDGREHNEFPKQEVK